MGVRCCAHGRGAFSCTTATTTTTPSRQKRAGCVLPKPPRVGDTKLKETERYVNAREISALVAIEKVQSVIPPLIPSAILPFDLACHAAAFLHPKDTPIGPVSTEECRMFTVAAAKTNEGASSTGGGDDKVAATSLGGDSN